jgi:putative transcriptional regulator
MNSHLKSLRSARGWTQADLASRVGVSRQAIIAIEADQHDPSLALAYKMAAQFGVTVEEIFPNPFVG